LNYEAKWGIMVSGSDQIGKCADVIKSVRSQTAQIKNTLYLTGYPSVLQKIKAELQNCITSLDTCSGRTVAIKNLLSDSANTYKSNEQKLAGSSAASILFMGAAFSGAVIAGIAGTNPEATTNNGTAGGSVFKLENAAGSAGLYGLGYEIGDEGWYSRSVAAYLGKAKAEYEDGDFYAGVNAYVGKAEAEYDLGFTWMKGETKREKNDKGEWEEKTYFTLLNATAGAGASISALSADGKIKAGDDMLGAELKGEGAIGKAAAEAKGKLSMGDEGVNAYAKGELKATGAEGEVKGTINILGLEITGKAEGYAGSVGVEGEFGIKDNKFVMFGGASAILGGGLGFEIGFNDTGWKEFGKGVSNFANDVGKGAVAFADWITWWDN